MRPNNRSPFAKLGYLKSYKAHRPPQDPNNPYLGSIASERDLDATPFQIASNFLKITQIAPLKPPMPSYENVAPLRKIHNLRANTLKPEPGLYRMDLDESNTKDISADYRVSPLDRLELTKENKPKDLMITKIAVLRERLERKEQEKEKGREEVLKQTRQQNREKTKEDIYKQPLKTQPAQNIEKVDTVKAIKQQQQIQQAQQPRELISDADAKKISLYFRHKIVYISKVVEERIRGMNTSTVKPGKVAKLKALNTSIVPAQSTSPGLPKSPLETLCSEEIAILDEVWKYLKAITSTKSRYKHRDVVNYNKKIRETIKTLLPANSPKLQKDSLSGPNVTLHDEGGPKKSKLKKSKSPDPEKLAAINEFFMLKKENPSAKVYICVGAYPALRQALEERGWIENPDTSSKDFDLKWTPKAEINYDLLKPHQYFNHYEKHAILTTKLGLARSIKNLIWYENEDIDEYYPRCFDLNDVNDFDDFLEDFKFEEVIATLRLTKSQKEDTSVASYNLFKLKLCLALSVCERRVKALDMLLCDMIKGESPIFTQEEWELMCAQESENIIDNAKYDKIVKNMKEKYGIEFEGLSSENDEAIFTQAEAVLAKLQKEYPQLSMNQGKNIWIVKPAGLSRGRGICCHNSLPNVIEHIKIKGSEWVAQKYIENPLIIKNRKFDIRQWVLVTDWNPLTIWFYDENYVRFTAQDFNPEDLNNKFAHLTNNAIGKYADNFCTSEIEGNMWDCQGLRTYVQELTGKDTYEEYIKPQMRNIVIKTLLSGQDMIDSRKNSFDLYGYDFMIDENYKVLVLEINSSPSLEYSTSVTERLVSQMMGDMVKVVIDYGQSKGKSKKNVDTGNFQCIYAGKEV